MDEDLRARLGGWATMYCLIGSIDCGVCRCLSSTAPSQACETCSTAIDCEDSSCVRHRPLPVSRCWPPSVLPRRLCSTTPSDHPCLHSIECFLALHSGVLTNACARCIDTRLCRLPLAACPLSLAPPSSPFCPATRPSPHPPRQSRRLVFLHKRAIPNRCCSARRASNQPARFRRE